jgi:hypothetical protein
LEGVREMAGRLFREKKITVSSIGPLKEVIDLANI